MIVMVGLLDLEKHLQIGALLKAEVVYAVVGVSVSFDRAFDAVVFYLSYSGNVWLF